MHDPAAPSRSLGPFDSMAVTEPDDGAIRIPRKLFEEVLVEIDALVAAETKVRAAFVAFGKRGLAVEKANAFVAFGRAMAEFGGHRMDLLRLKRCLRESDPELELTPLASRIGSRTDIKAAFDRTNEFADHAAAALRKKPTS